MPLLSAAGAPERVVYVDLDPNKLDAYNLTLEQIGNKILAENKDISSGNVKMGQMDYTLRVEGEFEESDQIKNIVLGTQNDKIIYLRDVANVRDTLKDITLEQTINRGRGGVLMVTKQTDANAVAVAKQAKSEIEKAQRELPTDIKFQIISDNSDFIIKSINNLQEVFDVRFDLRDLDRVLILATLESNLHHRIDNPDFLDCCFHLLICNRGVA